MAALLVRTGQVISKDRLMAEIWGDEAPRRADASLYVYVCQLRKFLRAASPQERRLTTCPGGYILHTDPAEIDAEDFQQFTERGRSQFRAGQYEQAAESLGFALRLWRGPAFGDGQQGPMVHAYGTWLAECRLECTELLAECSIRLGRHREVIGYLSSLIVEHPLREVFYRLLMIALYGSDRQAEALEVYRTARARLSAEIGLDPCRSLQDLHKAILTGDTSVSELLAA
ncbi:AfsR/SARP family transcriptional regulator [Streptomyces samsunensis]|uniref:AfsR/SARP family transcriptional regulator n=2 Tax=Streptomyces malaysiensis TaxID=92644 RepID=A0A9X2RYK5_STRMQ|nr:AfsR/SARP family transcriptional regulator [Streptomyces samsunensis]